MEDPFCGEVEARGGLCRAGGTAAQLFAGTKKLFACGAVNGTVDAAPAEQGAVGGIDDGVHPELGNVPAKYLELGHLRLLNET